MDNLHCNKSITAPSCGTLAQGGGSTIQKWTCTWYQNANSLFVSPMQVEVKPYVLDDQLCDECQGARCGGKFAPFFCANVTCLQYYCEYCWAAIHSRAGREFHKPLVKEGGDRPRHISFRWNWRMNDSRAHLQASEEVPSSVNSNSSSASSHWHVLHSSV